MKLNPWSENRKLRARVADLESDLRLAALKQDDLADTLRVTQRDLDAASQQLDVERRSTQKLTAKLHAMRLDFNGLEAAHAAATQALDKLPKRDPKTGRMVKASAA